MYGSLKGVVSSMGISTKPALEIGTTCMKIGQWRGRKGIAHSQTLLIMLCFALNRLKRQLILFRNCI